MSTETERGHVLIITHGADHVPGEQDDYEFAVECQSLTLCGGWQTCTQEHHVAEDQDDEDEEEREFHGVVHTYRYGYDWTVPFPGCIVADHVGQWDTNVWEIAGDHGVGRHVVDDEWDDTCLTLIHVESLPALPSRADE